MKHLTTIILTLTYILLLAGSLYLMYINTTQRWTLTNVTRDLNICTQTVSNLDQQIINEEDRQAQVEFQLIQDELPYEEELYYNPIDVYVELERVDNELERGLQRPKEPVCVEFEYYFNNKVCIKYDL